MVSAGVTFSYEQNYRLQPKTLLNSITEQVFRLEPLALPGILVKSWKIPEITWAVEFIFTEAGAISFSTRDLSTQF